MADLCWINREGEVSYRESTRRTKKPNGTPSVPPWSKFMTPTVETSNTYDPLTGAGSSGGSKTVNSVSARKKKENTPVLDDWESFDG